MHIGFIEDTPLRGGTQIWVTEAVKDFINKKHKVSVIAPDKTFVADTCRDLGARVATYDYDDIVSNPEKYKQSWIDGLDGCDVAVTTVHPPRNGFHCSLFGAECIKAGGLKTILVPKTGSIVPWYKREYYMPDPDVETNVVCITSFTRDYLLDVYKIPGSKVDLIYQGTEIDRFTSTRETKAEALRRYPLPDAAGPVLGSVGAMEPRKGQVILLQAIKRILDAGRLPDIHVMFVGEGPDEPMLQAVTKAYGLEKHVSFFPFTNEPNYVFERIDILAFPSLYKEGLPNVLLEAMSMKVPVISTRMAGIPEVVFDDETGFLTDPGNVEQFSDAIEKVWKNPETCAEMGCNARKLMEDRMDKKNQFNAFLKFFAQIT
ncbi:glycosyltransferase family 4 protein [Lentisphaerota bacterium ZTH]|nr:glycosyltransferase family 4 protein [Lentisphaerota bacterium]WET06169.1 glycosyltransferase family 4 protein [Lentisphaerota bacterium ZTH]